MRFNKDFSQQYIESDVDHAVLAAWVCQLNKKMKDIRKDLEEYLDEENFDRDSFDQGLEQDLNALVLISTQK